MGKNMKKSTKIMAGLMVLALSGAVFAAEEGDVLGEYGAITVKYLNGKKTALIDSKSTETVEIAEDVEVDSIYYDRDYSGEWGKPGTLMLPFDFPSGCLSEFGQIYEMTGIGINGQETWQIDTKNMGSNGEFSANRPYFVRPSEGIKQINFPEWCLKNTMKKTTDADTKFAFDNWEFRGMYSYKKWEEGDPDIGFVYGFAAKEKVVDGKTIQEGQFVKVKAGASIRPFRAYLMYNKNSAANAPKALAKSDAETASLTVEDMPSSIEVVFHDDEETTAIYMWNTLTGEFKAASGWYDMKGRKLDKKPTISGNYFYNGKKVTIK